MARLTGALALVAALGLPATESARAADLPMPAPLPTFALIDATPRFELRGGLAASTWGPETGEVNFNAEFDSPRLYTFQGWERFFIPRVQVGGTANLQGGTSYFYGGPMWTVDYGRYFADFSVGGAVHDGQSANINPKRNVLGGCRVLYHTGADVGYQFDEHWSGMITFDHISNGSGTLSSCGKNEGATILGVRIGYRF
ncbi:MAG: acyloxyacyl hydrolase [Methylobacteriaceae bacterium]|nr:acyloxyacyl hydrolase [Methylobacteriaceae bacterium]